MAATNHATLTYPIDAYYLPDGTDLVPQEVTLTDRDGDGDIGKGDQIDGVRITHAYKGDSVVVETDSGPATIEGVTFYLKNGDTHFMSTDGTVLQSGSSAGSTWVNSSSDVPLSNVTPPCFVAGTRIAVPGGWELVEKLQVGDLVQTLDNGAQPILWVGRRTLCGTGRCAPVEFQPGALGNARPLRVSQQHRVLVRDGRMAMLFDTSEALMAASHLTDGHWARITPRRQVTYVHLLFAKHEIVFSEGATTESLHPGKEALDGIEDASRKELLMLMPELSVPGNAYGPFARPVLRRYEARVTRDWVFANGRLSPKEHPSFPPV